MHMAAPFPRLKYIAYLHRLMIAENITQVF